MEYLKELGMHLHRVSCIMLDFAQYLGLDEVSQKQCFIAGTQHDLGKFIIDEDILNKPSALNEDEMMHLRQHVDFGYVNTAGYDHEVWAAVSEHHENYDGTGYPYRLKGNEISYFGRMLRIADSYDALRTKRAYKSSMDNKQAIEIMKSEKRFYDPFLFAKYEKMLISWDRDYYYCNSPHAIKVNAM